MNLYPVVTCFLLIVIRHQYLFYTIFPSCWHVHTFTAMLRAIVLAFNTKFTCVHSQQIVHNLHLSFFVLLLYQCFINVIVILWFCIQVNDSVIALRTQPYITRCKFLFPVTCCHPSAVRYESVSGCYMLPVDCH